MKHNLCEMMDAHMMLPLKKTKSPTVLVLLTMGLLLGAAGCGSPKSVKVPPSAGGGDPASPDKKPDQPQKPQEAIGSWRFFCVEGQTQSNVLTFRGAINSGAQPKTLLVRDQNLLAITDLAQVRPLVFSKQQGEFMFVGKKIEVDSIRLTPEKSALHLVKLDFFKGESRWIREYPLIEMSKSFLRQIPWASEKYAAYGWNNKDQLLMVPGDSDVWRLVQWKNFAEQKVSAWSHKTYFNPIAWNGQWLWWYWDRDKKAGRLEVWDLNGGGAAELQANLWTRGRLLDIKASDTLVTALFVEETGESKKIHWLTFDSDLKLQSHKQLSFGNWVLGIDPDLQTAWVTSAMKSELKWLEWNRSVISETLVSVPLREGEDGTSLKQVAKFGANLLLQFQQGENRYWKRKSVEGWSSLDRLDCDGLSYIKDQETP
jgi:hypothetical protein